MDIEKLEQNIHYTFKNKELLKTALTHTSFAHEKKVESNEKLEFLGDSILEFVTSNYLYNNYRKKTLTKAQVNLMNVSQTLYSGLLIKVLPLLIGSLILTFLLVKSKMTKFFYLLIGIEVIAILILHYSTISMSMMLYEQTKIFSTLSNMFTIVGIYLLIPLLSIILYIILRKRI